VEGCRLADGRVLGVNMMRSSKAPANGIRTKNRAK